MSSEASFTYGPDLVEAVRATLDRPDWQLHFPAFPNVPCLWTFGLGNQSSPGVQLHRPKNAYLLEKKSLKVEGRLGAGGTSRPAALTSQRQDVEWLLRNSPLPTELAPLSKANKGKNAPPSSTQQREFSSLRRLFIVGVKDKGICTAKALRKHILTPLQNALIAREGETPQDQAELNSASRECFNGSTPWDRAARDIIHRVALSSSGQLAWRPQYFQYSLSKLVLRGCRLRSECLRPLGEFIVTDRNLVTLDLSENALMVSAQDVSDFDVLWLTHGHPADRSSSDRGLRRPDQRVTFDLA